MRDKSGTQQVAAKTARLRNTRILGQPLGVLFCALFCELHLVQLNCRGLQFYWTSKLIENTSRKDFCFS